jgi:uncharacterized protein (DUF1501 family)
MRTNRFNRRRFLKGAALGAASVAIQPILGTGRAHAAGVQGTPGRFMVIINLLGGNDGLNTVVPTHLTPYVERRPAINLVENLPSGKVLHDLSGGYKLHYELESTKQLWDSGDLHVVQKVSYPSPNQSHFTSQDIFSYGVRYNESDGDGRGWLGRFADIYASDPVEPLGVVSVGLGRRRDFESRITSPLVLSSVDTFEVEEDREYRSDHELRVATVRSTLATDSDPEREPALTIHHANKQAYDLVERIQSGTAGWQEPAQAYPTNTSIGRYLRTISQLLHAHRSFQTRIFYTGFGGFDTHSGQHSDEGGKNRHELLMRYLDDALGAFAADLQAKGLWDDCVVVVISEFGRRVFENGSTGTDHGHANAFLVAGGGVKGRAAGAGMTGEISESDLAQNSNLPYSIDFRDIYGNIVADHLGLDPAGLFPDPGYSPSTVEVV